MLEVLSKLKEWKEVQQGLLSYPHKKTISLMKRENIK